VGMYVFVSTCVYVSGRACLGLHVYSICLICFLSAASVLYVFRGGFSGCALDIHGSFALDALSSCF